MIQKTIRDWGGTEFTTTEGAEQQTEWNDRTVYGVDGYNSIAELGANQAPMKVKTDFITVTQAVDLDTMESDISTNNGKLTYPSADSTKVGFITITQAVDLDTIESDTATNNAKTSYTDAAQVATNKTNADASKVITDFITITQGVNLDTVESDTATNNAKVTYPSADSTKVGFISVTQAVDLDSMESDLAGKAGLADANTFTGFNTFSSAATTLGSTSSSSTTAAFNYTGKTGTTAIGVNNATELSDQWEDTTVFSRNDTEVSFPALSIAEINSKGATSALTKGYTDVTYDLLFKDIVTSVGNYTTNAQDADTKKTVYMTSGTTLTLDKTSLTVDFQQQLFNSTGGAVTISSSDITEGGITSIPDGGFCYYTLINATTWLVSATASTTGLNNVVEDTTPQAGGEFDLQAHSIGGTVQTSTGDGTTTIDWKLGNMFNFQFGAFNETFTFTAPTKPGTFILKMVQDSVGSRTVTFPGTVEWAGGSAPTLTTTATTGTDIITFYYDGTNYFAVDALNFS